LSRPRATKHVIRDVAARRKRASGKKHVTNKSFIINPAISHKKKRKEKKNSFLCNGDIMATVAN